jgi:hypothetical protein
MRMRFLRVNEDRVETLTEDPGVTPANLLPPAPSDVPDEKLMLHEVIGAGDETASDAQAERIDTIAQRYFNGKPWMWRMIAGFNNIDNPLSLASGLVLRIPPESAQGNDS